MTAEPNASAPQPRDAAQSDNDLPLTGFAVTPAGRFTNVATAPSSAT